MIFAADEFLPVEWYMYMYKKKQRHIAIWNASIQCECDEAGAK